MPVSFSQTYDIIDKNEQISNRPKAIYYGMGKGGTIRKWSESRCKKETQMIEGLLRAEKGYLCLVFEVYEILDPIS